MKSWIRRASKPRHKEHEQEYQEKAKKVCQAVIKCGKRREQICGRIFSRTQWFWSKEKGTRKLQYYRFPTSKETIKDDKTNTTIIKVTFSNWNIYNTQIKNREYGEETRCDIARAVFEMIYNEEIQDIKKSLSDKIEEKGYILTHAGRPK